MTDKQAQQPPAPPTLAARLLAIMQDVGGIQKREHNVKSERAQYTMNAVSENDILQKVHPALIAHGVLVWPELACHETDGPLLIVSMNFVFEDVESGVTRSVKAAGMAKLTDDKAMSKAVTDANKNLWKKLLQIHDPADTRTPQRSGAMQHSPAQPPQQESAPFADCQRVVGVLSEPSQPKGKSYYNVILTRSHDGGKHDLSFFAKGTLLDDVRHASQNGVTITAFIQAKGKYRNLVGIADTPQDGTEPKAPTEARK